MMLPGRAISSARRQPLRRGGIICLRDAISGTDALHDAPRSLSSRQSPSSAQTSEAPAVHVPSPLAHMSPYHCRLHMSTLSTLSHFPCPFPPSLVVLRKEFLPSRCIKLQILFSCFEPRFSTVRMLKKPRVQHQLSHGDGSDALLRPDNVQSLGVSRPQSETLLAGTPIV